MHNDASITTEPSERLRAVASRWLGVGLASGLSVVTLVLTFTGQLTLYISPETIWFAASAAVVTLVFAVWSCTLPLGAESDHGHDHGHSGATDSHDGATVSHDGANDRHSGARESHTASAARRGLAVGAVISGGFIATAVVVGALVLPPASLSVQMALSRSAADSVLFGGPDVTTLAAANDTSSFGIGEWSAVFGTAPRAELYDGAPVTLTGFLTPANEDGNSSDPRLTRMVITHCVIDAQPAAVPVRLPDWQANHAVGDWVEVTGVVRADADGTLRVEPTEVTPIDEPGDPYEY